MTIMSWREAMPKISTQRPPRARLNMRIPEPLLDWAKDYAVVRNTTITQIIIDHFTKLRETSNGKSSPAQHR